MIRERRVEGPEIMSAIQPTPVDGDNEALHRAQRQHEPSMEEILASIRAIIADDNDPGKPAARRATPPSEPKIVYSSDAPAGAIADSPAPRTGPDASPERAVLEVAPAPARETPPTPVVVWARPPAEASEAQAGVAFEPEPPTEPTPEPEPSDEPPLLSDEADRSVAASFEALSATVALQSAEMVERLTREMLRPMIKIWLDEHLPSLVERLVRAEIQRVARGGR